MRKTFRILIVILLSIIVESFSPILVNKTTKANASDNGSVNLVLDSLTHEGELPHNFRKTTDLTRIVENKSLNLMGLDKLNISGSEQFTESNLPLLVKSIGILEPITILDLRQESHGFMSGLAVSWANSKNNANLGLSREEVLLNELNKLKSIKPNVPISFYNYPKKIVVPDKVQSESQLTNSSSLYYIRVPVTDGGLPTDDMVDYFIDFVKIQPRNLWIHFHCKRGIGRTTTFMVMYDMMRNYKEVSAEDIINRQLALAGFDENNIKSFKSDKRMAFLKNFYDYCKKNGDSFKVRWSERGKADNSSLKNNLGYLKNGIMPRFLYVISLDKLLPAERTMVASLQGLVNGRSSFQIYTLNSEQPDYKIWLEDLKKNYSISYKVISDPWQLISLYRSYANGYVLYSSKSLDDPSINNACSLAAIKGAVVIDENIEAKVRKLGITKLNGDCRNTDESWAYNNLWNKGLNHSIVIELSPSKTSPLRDYAIMTKSLVFYENSIHKTDVRGKIFSSMKDSAVCLGWGPDEFINVRTASKYGVSVVAADWSYNLTTLSSFPLVSDIKKASPSIPQEKNVHYVTFVMSDGDNQQWNLGNNYTSYKWFGYPNRKNLSLGWSLSPSIYFLAPTVFDRYYKSISNELSYNNFIVAPSGNGYMYPSEFDKNKLSSYTSMLNEYMGKVNERYTAVIDDSNMDNAELWSKFTERHNIEGLFYLNYYKHDKFQGKVIWSNNKPIVSCRDLLWSNIEDEDELVKKISNRIQLGEVDVASPEAYTFVYVHAWSKTVKDVEDALNKLKKIPEVRIVTPEVFMKLIKKNVIH